MQTSRTSRTNTTTRPDNRQAEGGGLLEWNPRKGEDDEEDDSTHPRSLNPKNAVDEWDTPHFNAVEHTQRHVWTTAG